MNVRETGHENPRETSNFAAVLLWTWTIKFFKVGYQKILGKEDLYDPLKCDRSNFLGDKLERSWNEELRKSKELGRSASLTRALFRTFLWEFSWLGLLQILNELLLRLGTPILIGLMLSDFRENEGSSYNQALIYGAGVCLSLGVYAVSTNLWLYEVYHVGGKIRIAVCSVVYRKALRLNIINLGETTSGKIVNLLANDVNRFDFVILFIHFLWSAPLAASIVAYFLWTEAGYSGLIGIAVIFIIVPIQSYSAKLSAKYRLQTTVKTDERVRLMNEIISGVQVIKMYAWEKPFCKVLALIRKLELTEIRKNSWVHGFFITLYMFIPRTALYCTLVGMVLFGEPLSTEKVFVFFSYYTVLAEVMGFMFSRGISEIAQCRITVKRLESFLKTKEFQDSKNFASSMDKVSSKRVSKYGIVSIDNNNSETTKESEHAENIEENKYSMFCENQNISIELHNLTAKWNESSTENTLEDINAIIERGRMYVMIGSVGAGKTSLIAAILGEVSISGGHIDIHGSISYASQEAWIFGSAVRHNILFGQPYDAQRYQEVVEACALLRDFDQFPHGDQTVLGERGSSLSGGQKARINLARSVYRESDIYIFDDPLSAVDAQVGKHLFEECFDKYLNGTTRILVTHQVQYVHRADAILLIDHGKLMKFKNYEDLLLARPEYANLLSSNSTSGNNDDAIDNESSNKSSIDNQKGISNFLSHNETSEEDENDMELTNALEKTSKGTVTGSIFINYLRSGNTWCFIFAVPLCAILTQCAVTFYDMFFPRMVEAEEKRYNKYLREKLNNSLQGSMSFNEFDIEPAYDYFYIYTGITVSIFIFGFIGSMMFYVMCLHSSRNLHDNAFNALIRTGMQFFSVNPSGRILNRFSKDIDAVDDLLPKTLHDAIIILLIAVGALTIVCSINPFFLIPLVIIAGFFYTITRIYIKASKNLKRLEGIMRSPVFTHLNVTMNGLITIRASGAQKLLKHEFDRFQDGHTSAWFMFIATSNAFGFSLDVFCFIFTTIVTFGLLVSNGYAGSEVGLAITSVISMTSLLQWGVRQLAEVINQMMSVERILEYTSLPPEDNLGHVNLVKIERSDGSDKDNTGKIQTIASIPPDWPSEGCIAFRHVCLTYNEDTLPVLKDLNFVIRSREKVGIVGRTGAGKSSLISAIFRLTNIEGSIEIDGIDTGSIKLDYLRRNIAIIPQEPVLFSGNLRKNLDPFDEFSDNELWSVLEQVELKDAVSREVNGLDRRVVDKGANFSIGQRQLICLARAILRNNKILVLDEATANVDPHTDELIQKTIRRNFSTCTVITVAHRLNTIMDSDKVIVMDDGRIMEFDHPYVLLQDQNGTFTSLVNKNGHGMSEKLLGIAKQSYERKN